MSRKEGFVAQADKDVTVVLDTNLTTELLEEGFSAEVISKIQTMRKDAGFEVMDKIIVSYQAGEKIHAIFEKYGAQIQSEVLAQQIDSAVVKGYEKEWNINGEKVAMGVEKV